MKIICTQDEKNQIVYALCESTYCARGLSLLLMTQCKEGSCRECIEKSIEWKIKDVE